MGEVITADIVRCCKCESKLNVPTVVLREANVYCISCYEKTFPSTCIKCTEKIGVYSKDLSYHDQHWHEQCFKCSECGSSLIEKSFGFQHGQIMCANCYSEALHRCGSCQSDLDSSVSNQQ